ncbi:hypothetical protein AB9P05_22800 [Roseivirga sp. BDSF3-8]|uniref:hypothetical protein n=1 Tax=Roseivirga sp. BDSF3-8 TaxID=3241598 RepID=UPI0035319DC5
MKLEEFQQNVLNALKERSGPSDEHPYFTDLRGSYVYKLTHETVVYWRTSQISRLCVLTTRYLNSVNRLGEVIMELYKKYALSNFADEVSFSFLDKMAESEDHILASVAAFERANLARRFGREVPMVTKWKCEPTAILHALMKNNYSIEAQKPGSFITHVLPEVSQGFEIHSSEEWSKKQDETYYQY